MDMKQFDKSIKAIKTNGAKLDTAIHQCAVFSVEQLNMHGNNGAANKLLSALNKSSRKEALFTWFNDFSMSKRNHKDNTIEYSKNKKLSFDGVDISPANAVDLADANPFYEYTKEITPASSYDVIKGIKAILSRAKKMAKDGKTVEHSELLAKLEAFVPAE
jgi:hypothetical protein